MERNEKLKTLSQQRRKNPTKEERLLWNAFLRRYPHQFRRQYIIGNYIADFYCHAAKLVVELDGSQHYLPDEREKDQIRTNYFHAQGLTVLRFSNAEITRQFQSVCHAIDLAVNEQLSLSTNFSEKRYFRRSSSAPSGHLLPGRRDLHSATLEICLCP